MISEEWQQHIASTAAHWCEMAKESVSQAARSYERPSAVFRPSLRIDGNKWCAIYGENLQDGVAGFGDSPEDAMWDFDKNWNTKLQNKTQESNAEEVLRAHGFPEFRKS